MLWVSATIFEHMVQSFNTYYALYMHSIYVYIHSICNTYYALYMYMYIGYLTRTMHYTISVTLRSMSLDQENPGVHMLSENSGRHRAGGRGRLDICYSETGYPTTPVIGRLGFNAFFRSWLTLGSHLQGLYIFTIWRRPRKAFSFLCVCAEVQITINIDCIFQACVKGMYLILMCSEII